MAHTLSPDEIDFSAYMRQTEAAVKVRKASVFVDDLDDEFRDHGPGPRFPTMFVRGAQGRIQFAPGDVTCWTGYNGHRKSMFTSQVCLDLCKQGQRVLIASLEMTPGKTLARMARQAAGTSRPEERWRRAFVQWTDDRLWLFDHLGRINPDAMVAVCRYFASELQGTHVVIDSMMMVCASEESMDEQKQFVTDLVRVAQETGLHLHLVTHCRKPPSGDENKPPSKYDVRGASAITDQCANVITIWANKHKKAALEDNPMDMAVADQPDAVIEVVKQRHGGWEGKVRLFFDTSSLRFCDDRISAVEPYELAIDTPAPAQFATSENRIAEPA